MSAQVQLRVVQDNAECETLTFSQPKQYSVGRAVDCDLQFSAEVGNKDISRHHCIFSIDPPHIWIHDLGSKNGTYVNEERISPQLGNDPAELKEGDEVRIGHQVVHVHIEDQIPTGEFIGSHALAEWIT